MDLYKPNAMWRQILWQAMGKTGRGYRKHSLGHTGKGLDRRNDKLRSVDVVEDGKPHTELREFHPAERKIERAARLGAL